MAVIHNDPLPPRTTPGEVLRFVADRGPLDGKQVGKIAFIGRGATIEIPDARAAAVVAALDGAVFRDRPARARNSSSNFSFSMRLTLRPCSGERVHCL
jgi:hypothetical protein